jgi:hypothetical protein
MLITVCDCAQCSVRCAMCGILIHAVCNVRYSAAVCVAVTGSACGSVGLSGGARQCAAVRQCGSV